MKPIFSFLLGSPSRPGRMNFFQSWTQALVVLVMVGLLSGVASAADRRIIMIAGKPTHGPGEHEFRAGLLLLQTCLADVPGIKAEVYSNDWPVNSAVFEGAAAVVIYSGGGSGHPALQADHLQQLGALMKRGVGLACIHYAVEPTVEKGQHELIDWIGGCFEINRSVNPNWEANFLNFPDHPVTRGVKPFKVRDEWYFNMHFRDRMAGVTPLLAAIPPEQTMYRKDGPHEGNAGVRAMVERGEPQILAWAAEREDGGRGFGFTGGHAHLNWGNDNFRKLVLNAILWVSKVEVPKDGVESTIPAGGMEKNLDLKVRK